MTIDTSNLINEDVHFDELESYIQAIGYQHAHKQTLGPIYLKEVRETLLNDTEKYFINSYKVLLNRITAEKKYNYPLKDLINFLRERTKNILKKYDNILLKSASVTSAIQEPALSRTLEALKFTSKFEEKLGQLCSNYGAKYAEYQEKKLTEAKQLEMQQDTLDKADEANQIARSSKRASWIFGILSNLIATGAFIIGCLAYFKNH